MPLIQSVNGKHPRIHKSAWISDNATITGNVVIGKNCSIWFQTVIRGDVNKIIIGDGVNIQDAAVIHGTMGRGDTIIGHNVSVGHRAIIHGCRIEDNVLVGMGAIILDDAVIPSNCVVAAGSVVLSGSTLESGFIYGGIPAKKLKPLDEKQADYYIKLTAQKYIEYAGWYSSKDDALS